MPLAAWQATIVDESGNIQAEASVEVLLESSGALAALFSDRDGAVPILNPVTADSQGFVRFYAAGSAFRINASLGDFERTWRHVAIGLLSERDIVTESLIRYEQTSDENTLEITPANFHYEPGDVRRWAVLDGVTDDTVALARWASVPGRHTWPVAQTARITAAIPLVSNSTYEFVDGARIETSTQNISLFSASSKTNIKIRGAHFKQTSAGSAASVAGVILDACSYCEIDDCEFEGMQWAGVYLNNSNQCKVIGNYFHDFLASSAGDKGDIIVYRNSSFNTIERNRCYGGLEVDHGILVQDPLGLGNFLPSNNKVIGNFVGDHKSYGIVFYIGGAQQGDNQCIANTVQNITGTGIAGASGSGIYCVGNGLGAQLIDSNKVRNCCISTTSAANGPGGISVNDTLSTGSAVIVTNNTVEDMPQGSGILISTVAGGAVVGGNTVLMPASNDGSGPGGATLQGDCYRVTSSFDVTVKGNKGRNLGDGDAFFAFASGVSVDRLDVSGNIFRAAVGNALRLDRTSSFVHTDCVIGCNQLRSDAAANLIHLVGVDRCAVSGNNGGANTGAAIAVTACTGLRISGSSMNTNGTNGLTTAGTCTGSNYDSSNRINGNVSNGATGFRVEQIGATPAAGTYVAGDTVWHTAPAAGASPGAICTTGGSPGTWKAMANLAA